jgi:hypothetical protein
VDRGGNKDAMKFERTAAKKEKQPAAAAGI